MTPNNPNNKVEEIVEEFTQEYADFLSENYLAPNKVREVFSEKLRQALTSSYEQGVRDERERIE